MTQIIYITKYALTKGIYSEEAEICKITNGDDLCAKVKPNVGYSSLYTYFKNEYFLTMEEAKADAEKRRLSKIKSLDNQIKKLEKLKF